MVVKVTRNVPPSAETTGDVLVPDANVILSSLGRCTKDIVWLTLPAVSVIYATLFFFSSFFSAVIVIVPFPDIPLLGVTLHHSAPSLTTAVHDELVVNDILIEPPSAETTGAISVPSAKVM